MPGPFPRSEPLTGTTRCPTVGRADFPGRASDARDHRPGQTLRIRRRARWRDLQRGTGSDRGVPRTQRRRQDDHDALHLRARPTRPRRGPMGGQACGPGGQASVWLHARATRPVSADAGRRAAQLLRPATWTAGPGGQRGGRSLARADGPAPGSSGWACSTGGRPSSRTCPTATSSVSSWRRPWSTTRSCSSSTSRSRGSTRSGSRP